MGESPADETPAGCPVCPVYRPDKTPRLPYRPPVCDGDRRLLDRHLAEVGALIVVSGDDHADITDHRRYERRGYRNQPLGLVWADPVGRLGGVAPINSRPNTPTVTGSREAPIPIRVNVVDLVGPARVPNPTDAARRWPEDQIGYLSAATVLDQWCRDVRDTLFPAHRLPPGVVADMVVWLRNRLDDVCDRHPAVAELAREVRDLRGALRAVAGESEPPPERCDGIPCRRCDLMTLFRQGDGDYRAECVSCGSLYTDDEYQDWVKTLAAQTGGKRHAAPTV